MKKPNITPGPWRIKDHEIEDFRVFGNCEGGALARVIKANNFGGTAQDQANARLIAAAPDLLAALEALLDYENGIQKAKAEQMAYAAIKKAVGQS